jgi:RNA polymerase sigma factor (sigma-70 family)
MGRVPTDDDELVHAVAAGDPDAFGALYRRHVDTILVFLRQRVTEPEVAFDLTAETFAAAVGAAARFEAGEAPVIAWLLGIARNKWLESVRHGRVESAARARLRLEPVHLEDADLVAVEERTAAAEPALVAALAALPEATRAAIVGRVIDERSYADVARELECSEQVVRQRVHRGLRRLRAALEEKR